jgi:hypothetical protein
MHSPTARAQLQLALLVVDLECLEPIDDIHSQQQRRLAVQLPVLKDRQLAKRNLDVAEEFGCSWLA